MLTKDVVKETQKVLKDNGVSEEFYNLEDLSYKIVEVISNLFDELNTYENRQ